MTENVQVPYNPTPEEIKTKKYERKLILFKEKLEAQLEMKQAELAAKDKRISFMEASKQFEEHVLREELEEVSKAKQEYYMTVNTQSRLLEKREAENRTLKQNAQYFEKQTDRERSDLHSKLDQKDTQIQELTAELSETISIESYEAMRNKYYETKEIKEELETKITGLENQVAATAEAMVYRGETIKDLQNLLTKNGIDWHHLIGAPKDMKEVRDRAERVKKAKRNKV